MDKFLFDHRLELFSSILTACKKVFHLITVSDSSAQEVAKLCWRYLSKCVSFEYHTGVQIPVELIEIILTHFIRSYQDTLSEREHTTSVQRTAAQQHSHPMCYYVEFLNFEIDTRYIDPRNERSTTTSS